VFFAVGFETTAPATAVAIQQAASLQLDNFSLLVSHVRVLPAMKLLASNPDSSVQGFLAAGHVCAVTGFEEYRAFCHETELPVVVTGFEPVDLLAGILECVRQLEADEASVSNPYARSVAATGNRHAADVILDVFENCDRAWRGFGVVPGGGLKLRDRWRHFDAASRFGGASRPVVEPADCRSGDVLSGRISPPECERFGDRCTPETPLGAPMVSAEGACAAYFKYARPYPR
jgi:hydrogenase expression/formation protein HypD